MWRRSRNVAWAALVVTPEHGATQSGRNGLLGAGGRAGTISVVAVTLRVHVGVAIAGVMATDRRVHVHGNFASIRTKPCARVLSLVTVDALHGRVLIRG
jgi:hypothetical protein